MIIGEIMLILKNFAILQIDRDYFLRETHHLIRYRDYDVKRKRCVMSNREFLFRNCVQRDSTLLRYLSTNRTLRIRFSSSCECIACAEKRVELHS